MRARTTPRFADGRLTSLGAGEARRIALAAQGFGGMPPMRRGPAALRATAERLGAVQIDSVNVLVRSHYLPFFSRLGPYDRSALDRMVWGRAPSLFEYWAHEASLVPVERFALFRWRMQRARGGRGTWGSVSRIARERPELVERVCATIESRGPMTASDFEDARSGGGWWGWSDTKRALEYLFWAGAVTTKTRRSSFERVYDLTERVVAAELLRDELPEADAQRRLVELAAAAFGIATEADLRDYFRLDVADARARIGELVEGGGLLPVTVEGWKQQAYLAKGTRVPRAIDRSALLSPFDSLVWFRPRTHRLFDFHYRIEIYTPKHKRVHGYYVLPFLFGDRLVARVDLKADREAGVLRVHATHLEPKVERSPVLAALREQLRTLAEWLELRPARTLNVRG